MKLNKGKSLKFILGALLSTMLIIASSFPAYAYMTQRAETKHNVISVTKWYNVAFDKNAEDAVGTTEPHYKIKSNQEFNLNLSGFTRPGYLPNGWNTKADGSGDAYADGQTGLKGLDKQYGLAHDETLTLYAQWIPIQYTVLYSPNKPADAESDVMVEKGSDIIETSVADNNKNDTWMPASYHEFNVAKKLNENKYTLSGWKFEGWTENPDGTGRTFTDQEEVINLTQEPNGIVTIYAKWQPFSYNVHYFPNGGTGTTNPQDNISWENETDTDKMYVRTNGFTKKNHVFKGWSQNPQDDPDSITIIHETEKDPATGELKPVAHNKNNYHKDNGQAIEPGDTVKLYAIWEYVPIGDAYVRIQAQSSSGQKSTYKHEALYKDEVVHSDNKESEGKHGLTYEGVYYFSNYDDVYSDSYNNSDSEAKAEKYNKYKKTYSAVEEE